MFNSQENLQRNSLFKIRYRELQASPRIKDKKDSQKKQIRNVVSTLSELQGLKKKKSPSSTSRSKKAEKQRTFSLGKKKSQSVQLKQGKEYSRIPIEYFGERDHGNMADKVRGRVIYRGYAPKNTYYFIRTIKQLKSDIQTAINLRGQQIAFNSKFESGNLHAAVKMHSKQYWLFMREDSNTHGLRQWFYFEARAKKPSKFTFRIYKYTKSFSLYRDGMKPYVKTRFTEWKQQGQNVKYQFDKDQECYYLQFQFFLEQNQPTFFATLPPYTYSQMVKYMQLLQSDELVKVSKIGLSLSGFDIYSVQIKSLQLENSSSVVDKESSLNKKKSSKKQAVCIMARIHPGQTNSNFALEGFINRVLGCKEILEKYKFYILPMINPDGVYFGNHRTGILGQDLNRKFSSELQFFPQIQCVQKWLSSIKKQNNIAFLLDLHGHSARKNIFAYGEYDEIGSEKYLQRRALPKILSDTINTFRFDYCIFKSNKVKKNTARVYFSKKLNINCLTFQQSYGLMDSGQMGIQNWKNFGIALADSLLKYKKIMQKQNPIEFLQDYLKDEMDIQRSRAVRKNSKLKRLQQVKSAKKQKRFTTTVQPEIKSTQINRNKKTSSSSDNIKFSVKNSPVRKTSPNKKLNEGNQKQKPQHNYYQGKKISEAQAEAEQQQLQTSSIGSEELSSGDEDLELTDNQLETMKKQLFPIYHHKEYNKRQLYNLSEKKVQLKSELLMYEQKIHNQKVSMVPRILKLQMRKKDQFFNQPNHNQPMYQSENYSLGHKRASIQLPCIKRH